jgi:hypothetical protein
MWRWPPAGASALPLPQFEIYSPGLTFEVIYLSGTILTEASSIVETTHTPNVAHLFRGEAFHTGHLAGAKRGATWEETNRI